MSQRHHRVAPKRLKESTVTEACATSPELACTQCVACKSDIVAGAALCPVCKSHQSQFKVAISIRRRGGALDRCDLLAHLHDEYVPGDSQGLRVARRREC